LAACVYFVANTCPLAIIVCLTEKKPLLKTWRECYFWSFPYYLVGAALAASLEIIGRIVGWEASLLIFPILYWIYRSYRLYLERLEAEKRHVEEMAGLHLRTIEALALAIEAKDFNTYDHLRRVGVYAVEIAKELGLREPEVQALQAAALLHDIGKLAIPEHIISKPGRLTAAEFEKMKIHPVIGAEILDSVEFPYPVVPIVIAHHEKWDGTGYPNGLKAEEIPIGARILSAVDCFDAMASHRQYRRDASRSGVALYRLGGRKELRSKSRGDSGKEIYSAGDSSQGEAYFEFATLKTYQDLTRRRPCLWC
jgi:putative nucleotidyltransferase with HDIG domain